MDWLWMSLYHALAMLWATFWALVIGFTISGVLQVFVSKEQMSRAFGRTSLKTVGLAIGIGAASSSCSYAAAAAGRSALKQGAAFVPALAFMFASTNLVIELGAILWVLMGWRFVLAEFFGAFILIGLVWVMVRFIMPKSVQESARRHAEGGSDEGACCHEQGEDSGSGKWTALANAFVMDWMMMWKELFGGFLIAGFIATLVPHSWWQVAFLQNGPPAVRLIENAIVGPLIAMASFVCSCGNIPLASHLWANGISFGGVLSFIYADLLVLPLLLIYGKYYGGRAALWIAGIFFIAMVSAGIVVDLIFNLFGLIPSGPRQPSAVEHTSISWNYTSWLDLAAGVLFVTLLALYFRGRKGGSDTQDSSHAHCH